MNFPYEIINNIIKYQYPEYPYLNEIKEKIFKSIILSIEYLTFENYEDIQHGRGRDITKLVQLSNNYSDPIYLASEYMGSKNVHFLYHHIFQNL